MFRETVRASSALQSLKACANPEPIDLIQLTMPFGLLENEFVIKERPKSKEFERLGFTIVKKGSNYAWGVIEKS